MSRAARRVLDTSLLCRYWSQRLAGRPVSEVDEPEARAWGRELIEIRRSDAILTPIEIEFLAGARSARELRLYRAFLAPFRRLDDRRLLAEDCEAAIAYASRVPKDGKPRQLGDCLIRALARRLRCDVDTLDERFFG